MDKTRERQLFRWTKTLLQIGFFLFLPSAYNTAFSGVKCLFTQLGNGAALEWTPFSATLVVLLVYTVLFGRFFCGYACAFGSLGDWLFALHKYIAKKTGRPLKRMSRPLAKKLGYGKYVVLAVIAVLSFLGVYGSLKGWSPWEAFALLHARNFALGKHIVAIVLLLLIMAGMFFEERFFCKFLCPLGATFSLLPVFPVFALRRNRDECLHRCEACTKNCPANIALPKDGSLAVTGDCFQCGRCVGNCPKQTIHTGVSRKLKGNELWFTIVRALLLVGLFVWLGV